MYIHRALFTSSCYLHQDPHSQEREMKTFVIFLALSLSDERTHKKGTNIFFYKQKNVNFHYVSILPVVKQRFKISCSYCRKIKCKTKMGM